MLIRVDPASSLGLADQIAGQVRGQLAAGVLGPGDRLPSARDLARGLEVNMHTVLRAYATLRDEGLIELRRGRGAHVTPQAGEASGARLAEFRQQIASLRQTAAALGLSRDELLAEIRHADRP